MQNSKIYSILQYFDRYEQNRIRKYITSPYFNKHPILIQLFEIIIDHINANESEELDKENVWSELHPERPYDDVRFRKLCSELLKLTESYLAQQEYEKNPLHKATYLMEAVGSFKMEKLYNTSVRTANRLSQQQPFQPANFYFYQYQIEKNKYELEESELNRGSKTNYEAIISNLDYFFLAEKLKWFTSIISRQKIVNYEYDLLFIDEIMDHIKKYNYDKIPPISIYYQIFLTEKEFENEAHYYKLRDLIRDHILVFPVKEANAIYTHAINYCGTKINRGHSEFMKEFLDLNEDLLQKGLLIDGELSPWKFQNIVLVALRSDRFEWTRNFIDTYKEKIPEAYRNNAVTFAKARLYFYQRDYEKVIDLLREVEYEDISYNLATKAMLIITYYELDEIEPLYSLFDSFRTYLKRHKEIPQNRKMLYLNLIKFTRRLTKVLPNDKKAVEQIVKDLEENRKTANSEWLKEKVLELA